MIIRPARNTDGPAISKVMIECGLGEEPVYEFTGIVLVAERGGEVIGFAQAIPAKPVAFFALLAVHPTFQKSRAAYKLVEGVELLLRASGCHEWSAFIDEGNASWQRTVETWGATVVGHSGQLLRKGL